MELSSLVRRNRSYRRFDGSFVIQEETLRELVDLARYIPSAANRQPLKFALSFSPPWNGRIFDTLTWAAQLRDWQGPKERERPTAYIVVLHDTDITFDAEIDVGIAAQTILLGAVEKGLGGCMFANFKWEDLAGALRLPKNLKPLLVIALGKPAEKVVVEEVPAGGSIAYHRDDSQTHHVPKRPLEELIFALSAEPEKGDSG